MIERLGTRTSKGKARPLTGVPSLRRFMELLASRHPDLVPRGRDVFIRPVRFMTPAIYFDRISAANVVRPRCELYILARRYDAQPWGFTNGIAPPWNLDRTFDLTKEKESDELLALVEAHALPALRGLRDLDDVVGFFDQRDPYYPLRSRPHDFVVVLAVQGKLDEARAVVSQHRHTWRPMQGAPSHDIASFVWLHALADLVLADARKELLAHFEAAIEYSLDRFKLRDLYEPTPLPLAATMA